MKRIDKASEKAPRNLGLYIHIPFCRSKCLYCDFCSLATKDGALIERYISALCAELRERGREARDRRVDTVYFGGGTPSILSAEQIGRIIKTLRESFSVDAGAEITLECNPITHLADGTSYFCALRALGVNRLSFGVQSADDSELKLIGRRHSFAQAKQTYLDARRAGFENISLDLMLALPSQTSASLEYSIDSLLALSPEHISIYSLQLEEGTPLYRRRDKYYIPDDDAAADMYELAVKKMKEAGYIHYEISNFARTHAHESRHNSKYWSLDEYIGAGLASHSDFGGERSENTADMDDYLGGKYLLSSSKISEREREAEYIMLGLRTLRGISRSEFFARFGIDLDEKYGAEIQKFISLGFMSDGSDRISLNERGFEVSNSIIVEFLEK